MNLQRILITLFLTFIGILRSFGQVSDSSWFPLLDGEYGGALSNITKYDNIKQHVIFNDTDNNLKVTIDSKQRKMWIKTSSESFEFVFEGTKKSEQLRGTIPVYVYGAKIGGDYANIYVNTETKSKPLISFLHPKTNIQYIFQFFIFKK